MPDLEDELRRYGRAVDAAAAGAGGASGGVDDDEAIDLYGPRRRRVGRIARVAAVLAALGMLGTSVAVLVGGNDDDRVVTDPQVDGVLTAEDLAGRTFVVVALEVGGVSQPLAAQPPSLAFGDRTVLLDTGCNGARGDADVADQQLLVTGVSMELEGCGGTRGQQEHALLDLLLDTSTQAVEQRQHPSVFLAGDVLQVRLRDLSAVAVDVTEQSNVGGVAGEGASDLVQQLLQHIAFGEWDAASQLWQGYGGEHLDDASAARAELEQLAQDFPWLVRQAPDGRVTFGVTPAASFSPQVVVTAVAEPDEQGNRQTASFVVSPTARPALRRIPILDVAALDRPSGSTVAPGDRIALPGVPVEGGAVAHVNGVEVPADVNLEELTTSFVVPSWASGEIVVNLSTASPEEPTAAAAWYRVG